MNVADKNLNKVFEDVFAQTFENEKLIEDLGNVEFSAVAEELLRFVSYALEATDSHKQYYVGEQRISQFHFEAFAGYLEVSLHDLDIPPFIIENAKRRISLSGIFENTGRA